MSGNTSTWLAEAACAGALLAVAAVVGWQALESQPAGNLVAVLRAIDSQGDAWIAGVGDDCAEAFHNARIPADWRELSCRMERE